MTRRPRPLIGISAYDLAGSPEAYYLPKGYADAIRMAGGSPLILPPATDDVDDVLAVVDGVMLSGGGDVAPERYGGAPHETIYHVSPERDAFEAAIVHAVLARRDRPLLAICRGVQVLNVALGGDLHAHLPDVVGDSVPHRDADRKPTKHAITIDPESRLHGLLGTRTLEVRSRHHQAVNRVARSLRPVAWAQDGVVEALEHPEAPFCVGVQWHPELELEDPIERRLFSGFIEACRKSD